MIQKISFALLLSLPESTLSKSLSSMANSASAQLKLLGLSVTMLGLIWAGFLYIKGGGEGKQKLAEVITGAFFILGASAIVKLIRGIMGQ